MSMTCIKPDISGRMSSGPSNWTAYKAFPRTCQTSCRSLVVPASSSGLKTDRENSAPADHTGLLYGITKIRLPTHRTRPKGTKPVQVHPVIRIGIVCPGRACEIEVCLRRPDPPTTPTHLRTEPEVLDNRIALQWALHKLETALELHHAPGIKRTSHPSRPKKNPQGAKGPPCTGWSHPRCPYAPPPFRLPPRPGASRLFPRDKTQNNPANATAVAMTTARTTPRVPFPLSATTRLSNLFTSSVVSTAPFSEM